VLEKSRTVRARVDSSEISVRGIRNIKGVFSERKEFLRD